jgi:hypothetical protein
MCFLAFLHRTEIGRHRADANFYALLRRNWAKMSGNISPQRPSVNGPLRSTVRLQRQLQAFVCSLATSD